LIKLNFATWPRWLRDVAPVLLWMGLIFFLSSRSRLIEFAESVDDRLFYKTAHFIAYAFLTWLWWRAISPSRRATWLLLLGAWGLSTLYGVTDEFHQYFVPGRSAKLTDVLIDAAGGLTMLLFLRMLPWLRTFPENMWVGLTPSPKVIDRGYSKDL
jgi:VanZ family protein